MTEKTGEKVRVCRQIALYTGRFFHSLLQVTDGHLDQTPEEFERIVQAPLKEDARDHESSPYLSRFADTTIDLAKLKRMFTGIRD